MAHTMIFFFFQEILTKLAVISAQLTVYEVGIASSPTHLKPEVLLVYRVKRLNTASTTQIPCKYKYPAKSSYQNSEQYEQ